MDSLAEQDPICVVCPRSLQFILKETKNLKTLKCEASSLPLYVLKCCLDLLLDFALS